MTNTRLPEFDRLSIIAACVTLVFVLGQFIQLPNRALRFGLIGILIELQFNKQLLLALLAAGMAISGTSWLMSPSPAGGAVKGAAHLALPGLTAWVISVALSSIPLGPIWWIVLAAGTSILVLVWIAEFTLVNPGDENFRLAANGLTILSYALYLVLTINLRDAGTRLIYLLPAASLPVVVITNRYLILRLEAHGLLNPDNRYLALVAASAAGIAAAQFATVFHYYPVTPLGFGLALLSPVYAANIFFGNLVAERPSIRAIAEPAAALVLLWTAAALFQ